MGCWAVVGFLEQFSWFFFIVTSPQVSYNGMDINTYSIKKWQNQARDLRDIERQFGKHDLLLPAHTDNAPGEAVDGYHSTRTLLAQESIHDMKHGTAFCPAKKDGRDKLVFFISIASLFIKEAQR